MLVAFASAVKLRASKHTNQQLCVRYRYNINTFIMRHFKTPMIRLPGNVPKRHHALIATMPIALDAYPIWRKHAHKLVGVLGKYINCVTRKNMHLCSSRFHIEYCAAQGSFIALGAIITY